MEILFFQKMELLLYSIYKHLSFFIIGFPKRSLLSAGASRIFFQSGSQRANHRPDAGLCRLDHQSHGTV